MVGEAIAVFSVIFYHDKLHRVGRITDAPLHHYGFFGVDLFFAISGLLICSRLLEEEQVYHRIHLKDFYVRRFCRILPPAILFLIVIATLGLVHIIHVDLKAWLSSLLFYSNYYTAATHNTELSLYTNHFWSLSVEEHFYLLLPALLVFFPKHRTRILSVLVSIFLTYNLAVHSMPAVLNSMGGDYADVRTDLHIVSLLFPALLAIRLTKPEFRKRCEQWLVPSGTILLFAAIWVLTHFFAHMLAAKALVPLGFPFIILSTTLHPKSVLGRFLELRLLKFLGRISYSLYLWQQLFFNGDHPHAAGLLSVLQHWPVSLLSTLTCAVASYYLIERPFIRIGRRLAPPATEGRPA